MACLDAGIVDRTYYRRRKEYSGLQGDSARRLKGLEQENGKLKRLVSELSLEKLVLKDIASGNFQALRDGVGHCFTRNTSMA